MAEKPQTTEKKKKKFWVAFRIFTIVVVIILWCVADVIFEPKIQEQKIIKACENQVKEYLKAPSTAIFSNTEKRNVREYGWPVVYWMVESQNSFWAMIKDYYFCYEWEKDTKWRFRDVVFQNNEKDAQVFSLIYVKFYDPLKDY